MNRIFRRFINYIRKEKKQIIFALFAFIIYSLYYLIFKENSEVISMAAPVIVAGAAAASAGTATTGAVAAGTTAAATTTGAAGTAATTTAAGTATAGATTSETLATAKGTASGAVQTANTAKSAANTANIQTTVKRPVNTEVNAGKTDIGMRTGNTPDALKGIKEKNTSLDPATSKSAQKEASTSEVEKAKKWSKKDRQNMNYSISVVGYDPFDDCNMTDSDRRYCFNILAGYCDIEGIRDDSHKIQCVIQITQNQMQVRKIDEMINHELLATTPDEKRIKELTATKKQLQDSIAKMAEDNKLSSAYNEEKGAGKHTLSQKMKDMLADGYEAVRVNLFDIRTSECMKQIADLSNQSIMEQLTLDSNDYTEMIKEQREMITKLQEDTDILAEENRMLKNKIIDLETKKKSR